MKCEDLAELTRIALNRQCDEIADGTLRISTPFLYPDGSFVDLFLENRSVGGRFLSDLGETIAYLHSRSVVIEGQARKKIVSAICAPLDITLNKGQLELWLTDAVDLADGMMRLGQACIRVATLLYTSRASVDRSFRKVVVDAVRQTKLPFRSPVTMPGRFGKAVRIDAEVKGPRTSLVKTLSAGSHSAMVEAFRCWYDLDDLKDKSQFITVIDDDVASRRDDISRLAEVSKVVRFPAESSQFKKLLAV